MLPVPDLLETAPAAQTHPPRNSRPRTPLAPHPDQAPAAPTSSSNSTAAAQLDASLERLLSLKAAAAPQEEIDAAIEAARGAAAAAGANRVIPELNDGTFEVRGAFLRAAYEDLWTQCNDFLYTNAGDARPGHALCGDPPRGVS
jgi:hypothetical protein